MSVLVTPEDDMPALTHRSTGWDRRRLTLALQFLTLGAIVLGEGYNAARLIGG
jgi:hypothetical protein